MNTNIREIQSGSPLYSLVCYVIYVGQQWANFIGQGPHVVERTICWAVYIFLNIIW